MVLPREGSTRGSEARILRKGIGLRFTPLVPSADCGIADPLDMDGRAGVHFSRALDHLSLCGFDRASTLGSALSHRVVSLRATLDVDLLILHGLSPSRQAAQSNRYSILVIEHLFVPHAPKGALEPNFTP